MAGFSPSPLACAVAEANAVPVECPFAWKVEPCVPPGEFFQNGISSTISYTARRISKIAGYFLFIGTAIGITRIFEGIREFLTFNNGRYPFLKDRSIKWIARGVLETIPGVGGIICMIMDLVATIFHRFLPGW